MAVLLEGLDVVTFRFTIGDWLLDPHGGETGDVWGGFEADIERFIGAFWPVNGDLHLVAQGGETWDVAVSVGLDVEELAVED